MQRIRSMIRRSSVAAALCAVALTLPGCDSEAKKTEVTKTSKVEVKAPPTTEPEAKPEQPEQAKAEEPQAPDPAAEKVKVAATVAREIAADPEHADEVLARHGLDRAKLEAMMFEIAADPALTEAYMAERRTT
jgi:Tfp pilus assembly protein PilP